jgi:hypothetical protein
LSLALDRVSQEGGYVCSFAAHLAAERHDARDMLTAGS